MKKILIILFLFFSIAVSSNFVLAYNFNDGSGLNTTANGAGYDQSADAKTFLTSKIGIAISVVVSFIGIILLCLIIYGGYLWMTAMGNESQIDKAKEIIKNAIIGVIIVFCAYMITYVFKEFI